MDLRHHPGALEAQKLRQLPGGEAALLELGAHGAVKEQEAVSGEGRREGVDVGHGASLRAFFSVVLIGRSYRQHPSSR